MGLNKRKEKINILKQHRKKIIMIAEAQILPWITKRKRDRYKEQPEHKHVSNKRHEKNSKFRSNRNMANHQKNKKKSRNNKKIKKKNRNLSSQEKKRMLTYNITWLKESRRWINKHAKLLTGATRSFALPRPVQPPGPGSTCWAGPGLITMA